MQKSNSQGAMPATNPAIFEFEPRPGGVINVMEEQTCKCKPKKSAASVHSSYSRSSRLEAAKELIVQQGLSELDWTRTERDQATIGVGNPLDDSATMLSIVISTTLLMASETKVPPLHLDLTERYLNSVRDEYGHHPPNVQGLLNHISLLRGGDNKDKCSENVSKKGSRCSQRSK